eukprot:CAMPEP_0170197818 /NCGR_PEP_ID=MMETSP0040_2-20121228/67279_1 /TAXON_ID=641309 /ORGANISM="Lotharella oceanica, Strain CCMP622" /LENGTH=56 /DNA_ID=CAMNT_0010447587 /DNA_START=244 /DNA_END=414 /DNA_ORIENTATION=-
MARSPARRASVSPRRALHLEAGRQPSVWLISWPSSIQTILTSSSESQSHSDTTNPA